MSGVRIWSRVAGAMMFVTGAIAAGAAGGCGGSSNATNSAGGDASNDTSVSADVSAEAGCPSAQTMCGGSCTETSVDPQNCGSCGKACETGLVCSNGTCATECAVGLTQCPRDAGPTLCVDTTEDPYNCGGCGNACGVGWTCQKSGCIEGCAAGLILCPGWAGFDAGVLAIDAAPPGDAAPPSDAGASGDAATSNDSGALSDAAVEASVPLVLPGPPTCVDPKSDVHNCGGCGIVCAADQACTATGCTYAANCLDLLTLKGPLVDGTYTLDPDGAGPIKPFAVYCYGMETPAPKEYLTLVDSAESGLSDSNYVSDGNTVTTGGCTNCNSPFRRQFTRLRIDVATLVVDIADIAFSFVTDPSIYTCWEAAGGVCAGWAVGPFASPNDCLAHGSATGKANVDLVGTGFSIDPSVVFTPMGYAPAGTATFNAARTTVDVTGGGYCGGNSPSLPFLLKQD